MDENSAVVFDATRPVAVNLRTPEGVKTVRVRFPSDKEWAERQRRRKVLIKNLGRGMSETTAPNAEEVDAALLVNIRQNEEDGPTVDAFEASKVIEQIGLAEVDDVAPVDGGFRVSLRVLGGTTAHLLKVPSAKQVMEYRRGFARLIDLPFGRQEMTLHIGVAGAIYDEIVEATEGYAGPVPLLHKAVAAKAAIDALDSAFEEDRDANFQ